MTYMYTDENRERMADMLPSSWRDTFRAVWNLRAESPDEGWDEACAGVLALILRKHEVDDEHVADLRFSAAMVTMNAEEFGNNKHALACSRILTAAACHNYDERGRLLEEANRYLRSWHPRTKGKQPMTAKYTRNTLVPFGTMRNYSMPSAETRERLEAILDPELLTLGTVEADSREYPLHVYTRTVGLSKLDYAVVGENDAVLIREASFGPAAAGKLSLKLVQGDYSVEVPATCAADLGQLIGVEMPHWLRPTPRVIVDVYQAPRSGCFYIALARKEES